ncbi:uncharacterized protein AKAW2_40140A [Aspergillus luchuensis]|uniref:Similar to An09g01620 n=1 Tax=Aspergillus kawachii TaxID=1069201 RepID=A0A146F3L9_ASPKA|nr:uncharacterized protein AKAW2_40140A [Aspergillus luchuensis]BCR98457.1 hypothetical protein AKAW2_40140A [Aspergillus luchuensis]BCS10796.1 hypothetical protein ALUC_40136A [Aspergillus luchuensis]GAT20688.1 similar to An09g01620 [Aspergillus luchuensis]
MDTNAGTACSVLGPPEFPNHRSDSRHDEPRRQPAGFLFVDYQDQASHGSTLAKKKQAFIKKVYHQSKKERRLQKLKASIGQPINPSAKPKIPHIPHRTIRRIQLLRPSVAARWD